MKTIDTIARWLNVLLILITLLAYLAPFINPLKIWHLTFLGLAYPVLLLGNLTFIAYWIVRKNRYFLFSAGCIIAGFGYFSSFFGLHFFSEPDGVDTIKVMTFNVAGLRRFDEQDNEEKKMRTARLEAFSRQTGSPDIFCAQESSSELVTQLLKKTFGYGYHVKEVGTVIFSKYPIVKSGVLPFENTSNSAIWADLKLPDKTIRVYSIHLQSNWMGATAHKITTEGDLRREETWKNIGQLMRLYKRGAVRRAEQAGMVAGHAAESPHPVIICGDLNDPPVSYIYKTVSEGLTDSFCKEGIGIGATYAGKLPALRIDYVFSDKVFSVTEHRVLHPELSDHNPVLVYLKPNGSEE